MKNINDKTVVIITHEQPSMFYNVNVNFEAMNREGLRKILRGKCVTDEACEAAIDELLNLHSVSGSTDIPKPYKWLKEEKWNIPQGATYHDPKVTLTQCAGWITEYIKKYYR